MCTVKTHDDGQRNCPKHVEFYSKNKFEKLVHLVRFIIRVDVISVLIGLNECIHGGIEEAVNTAV